MASATVTLTNRPGGANESLNASVTGNITKAYDSSTGVLSLTGSETKANYQQVLRTVTYNNISQNPSTTSRSVTFVVNDGVSNSATATSTVTVLSVNDAPSFTKGANQTVVEDAGTQTVNN